MDCRRADPYVSCIKIHGVPILPPLMTEDIRTEMMYYKRLAIAVEERLKNLENSQSNFKRNIDLPLRDYISTTEESSNCESTSESLEKAVDVATAIEVPEKKLSSEKSKTNVENSDNVLPENTGDSSRHSWKSFSDDESNCRNDATTMDRTASSEIITVSTDINKYANGSLNSESATTTVENSPELRKPQVPKTLNIVPITVDSRVQSDATLYEKTGDTYVPVNDKRSLTSPESGATTPKLLRQGSYVLESPSPMLLAHLQEEIMSPKNYVPTAASNAVKRKEWNIGQAKSEWQLQRRNENFFVTDSSRGTPNRIRRNSASCACNKRGNARQSQSRTSEKHFAGSRQVARSVDCIQSMIYRENNLTNSKSSVNKINIKTKESPKINGPSNLKSTRSVSILNLANKLGGSLGCLSGADNRSCKRTPEKPRGGSRLSKSFDNDITEPTKSESIRGSTRKLLSAITSDKLVDVFKEIQTTHERQMIELMTRQRKEQQMMQKEFEKQQLLLFAQIEQSFPGICLPRLAEKVPMTPQSPFIERDDPTMTRNSRKTIDSSPKSVAINGSHSPTNDIHSKCALDDIYPREISRTSSAYRIKNSQSAHTLGNYKTTSPPIGLYSTSVLNGDRRQPGVNRQLFPLDSKTRRVPVLNNNFYEDRHIKAATVITAYAKGYLIRRLMQTERVIELKTTYKEALHCMLKLHVDAPLALPELNFHQRLQLQCDAASMNIVELFAQPAAKRMEIITQDRQIKRTRQERPNSARSSYSFATQRTLARKKLKEMGDFQTPAGSRPITARSRCQTWASNVREKRSPIIANQGIKRSTSAGAVRKPWR